jgi:hypothetical protein
MADSLSGRGTSKKVRHDLRSQCTCPRVQLQDSVRNSQDRLYQVARLYRVDDVGLTSTVLLFGVAESIRTASDAVPPGLPQSRKHHSEPSCVVLT